MYVFKRWYFQKYFANKLAYNELYIIQFHNGFESKKLLLQHMCKCVKVISIKNIFVLLNYITNKSNSKKLI